MPIWSRRFRSHSPTWRRAAIAAVLLLFPFALARGEDRPSGAVSQEPERRASPPRGASVRGLGAGARTEGTTGWWLSTAGVALALAACGWVSLLARRQRPGALAGSHVMRVIGRTSLSPKHTVYLLDVGGRVLIVGAGAQGAPSLLGELGDSGEPTRAAPRRGAAAASLLPGRFDQRLGDEV